MACLVDHLSRNGLDLHGDQFGFRRERLTVDAIVRVKFLTRVVVREDGIMLAMSLDILSGSDSSGLFPGQGGRVHRWIRLLIQKGTPP